MKLPAVVFPVTALSLLLVLAIGASRCERGPAAKQANHLDCLLIIIDTLRADHVSSYGSPRATSPVLDALAKEGVRVADVTAQSGWTAPSIVSMFVSRYLADDFLAVPPARTLAERLSLAGYRTMAFQYNHLLDKGHAFERGFDDYLLDPGTPLIARTLDRSDPRPRFMYLHITEPHDPYTPAKQFDVFPPEPLPEAKLARFRAWLKEQNPDRSDADVDAQVKAEAEAMAAEIARYDGEVMQANQHVRAILDQLEKRGTLGKTIVIVGADHGEGLWDHKELLAGLRGDKPTQLKKAFKQAHNTLVTQELVHVPLILRGPGIPAGVVLEGMHENVDIVPTILDLLGLEVPTDVDGESLLPAITEQAAGGHPRGKDFVYSHTKVSAAIRSRSGQKLIKPMDTAFGDMAVFFDLTVDPGEQNPLAVTGDIAEKLVRNLEARLAAALLPVNGEGEMDAETRRHMKENGYLK